jgi:hypothetical protein
MATLATTHPTLLDLAKRMDPQGKIDKIVEILNLTNEVLLDMVWVEGNLTTGNRTTVRTGLPTPTWRKLYGGVQPTKSTTAQVTDNCGMLEAYAEVDKALADLNGNTAEWRLSEETPHIEGMNEELATTIFYGDEGTAPEKFTGLSPRFNTTTAADGDNIILGGSSDTDNASIWLCVWGPNTGFGIVPKGSTAGLQMEDKGQVTIENVDGNGGRMEAYRSHYRMDCGLTIRDWRYFVRIPNIDRSLLTKDASTGADLPSLMFEAMDRIPNLGAGRAVFYMDRSVKTKVRQQLAYARSSSTLTVEEVGGVRTEMFQGIPMRRCDALSGDEALVS